MPSLVLSQAYTGNVGINTTQPTHTLDVNGKVRARVMDNGLKSDSIVVTRNGVLHKVALSDLLSGASGNKCPRLNRSSSSGHYLLFDSESSIPLPTTALTISGINFGYAGSWVSNNMYYYSWTNTTGNPLNINSNLTVNFNGLICQY